MAGEGQLDPRGNTLAACSNELGAPNFNAVGQDSGDHGIKQAQLRGGSLQPQLSAAAAQAMHSTAPAAAHTAAAHEKALRQWNCTPRYLNVSTMSSAASPQVEVGRGAGAAPAAPAAQPRCPSNTTTLVLAALTVRPQAAL